MPAKREVINGFMIHYKPYETDLGYKQYVVHGSDEREVLLSGLLTDTTYSLRMQSFNSEGFSEYSNTAVKKTMGKLEMNGCSSSFFYQCSERFCG